MTYRVVVEPTARRGIFEAVRWYRGLASPKVADKWSNGLFVRLQTLKDSPRLCPLAEEDELFEEEIRVLTYGKRRGTYRILFTIRADAVHVLFVRHGAQRPVTPDDLGDEP